MCYIVYKTTNKINGKIYIGAHKVKTVDDTYLGSGHLLKYAIKKYGKSNFIRETLFVFDNSEEMFTKELELVTEEFVKDINTYNLKLGGIGLDSITAKKNRQSTNQKLYDKYGENWNQIISKMGAKKRLEKFKFLMETDEQFKNKFQTHARSIGKLTLTDKAKQKRKETFKQNGHSQGEKNSQFGKMWIYNIETFENRKILKTNIIPTGWVKGRKIT